MNKILKVKIHGSYLEDQEFKFSSALNTFIGARGSGKSTLIEMVRYCLDAYPKDSAKEEYIEELMDANLNGGRIEMTVEKDGNEFIINRIHKEEPTISKSEGEYLNIESSIQDFFKIDIFSQNEIEEIAEKQLDQLSLLDSFQFEKLHEIELKIKDMILKMETQKTELVSLYTEDESQEIVEKSIEENEAKLEQLKEFDGEDASEINRVTENKTFREREEQAYIDAIADIKDFGVKLSPFATSLSETEGLLSDSELSNGPNGEFVKWLHSVVQKLDSESKGVIEKYLQTLRDSLTQINEKHVLLKSKHTQQELDDRKVIEKNDHAKKQASQRTSLVKEQADLKTKLSKIKNRDERIKKLLEEREEFRDELATLRAERFKTRKSVTEMVNQELGDFIKVSFSEDEQIQMYESSLGEMFKKGNIKYSRPANLIANRIPPMDLFELVQEKNREKLEAVTELSSHVASSVIEILSEPENLYSIDSVEINDLPEILLIDKGTPKKSNELSEGQKCNAILPILLLYKDNTVIIDQPEDNLDNRFIYDQIVSSLKKVKVNRQCVLISHNPCIPVLGESEKVFVMESDSVTSRISNEGSVDDCKEDIINLLEGGKEAFSTRKEKYGI